MKNLQPIISSPTYIGGWHVALHNYNAVEIDSIIQLVNLSNEKQSENLTATNKTHITTNLDD
jgi:hypothetical protein